MRALMRNDQLVRYGSVVGLLFIWEAAVRLSGGSLFLSAPSKILVSLVEWIGSGEIWPALKISTIEMALGFTLAAIVGILVGLAMGFNRQLRNVLEPTVAGLYSTPLLALTPLFIAWLGIDMTSKVVIIFFVVVFPIVINTAVGSGEVDRRHVDVIRSFGGTAFDVSRRVRLPAALPYILASMKIGVARSITAVFVAELFGATEGLGYAITRAARGFEIDRMWAGIVVLSLMGIVLSAAMESLGRMLAPWKRGQEVAGAARND